MVWEKRKYDEEFLDSECKKWLEQLIGMVDLTKDHPKVLLGKFISQAAVCKKYSAYISGQVRDMLDHIACNEICIYPIAWFFHNPYPLHNF